MEPNSGAAAHLGSDGRTWLVGVTVVTALVAIAVLAVVIAGSPRDAVYEAGSPEAVVQEYTRAWTAGDVDAAWELLTPGAQERMNRSGFDRAASRDKDMPTRVWVDERRDFDDRVVLVLSVEWSRDGLFGPAREIQPLRVTLVEIDGAWRIDTNLAGFRRW